MADVRGENINRAGAAASVKAQDRAGARKTSFEQRRLKLTRHLEEQVNAGKMSHGQAHAKLQRAGFIPGGSAAKEPTGVGGAIAKTVAAVATAPQTVAKKVAKGFTPHENLHDANHFTPVSPEYVKANPQAIYQRDKQGNHYKPKVGAGFVSPGTGLVAQTVTGLAQSATYNPAGVAASVAHPLRTAEHVARNIGHVVQHPGSRPDQTALLAWALLSGGGAAASRLAGAGSALRAGEGAAAALKRPGQAGGSLLHTPEPGTHPIYVPGAKPEGGIGPVNATQVDRLLSRNVVARELVQKPRNRRIQKALDKGAPAKAPKTGAGRFVRDNFSAQATVGREIRAARRVGIAKAQGPVTAQQRAVHGVFTLGNVSRGENTALQVLAIEGHDALTNADAVIARHIATHQRFIAEGKDRAANEAQIRDLKLAGRALKNPSDKFKAALQQTHQLSAETERKLIAAGHLTPKTAEERKAKIAAMYGHTAAPNGSFFYPLSRRYTENVSRVGGAAYSPKPSEAGGIGPPRSGAVVNKNPFTGKSVENAQRPVSVADALADRATRTNKLLDQEQVYADMWKVASPVRTSEHQIPIRDTVQVKSATRKFFAKLHDHLHAHPDEAAALNAQEAETLKRLLDAAEHKTAAVGAKINGVRWVDSRYLKDLGENSVRGPLEKALDTVTNPVRATSLYLRPAYALNLIGNATMQATTQGHLAVPAITRAVRAVRTDGPENVALVDSLVGASNSRAFSVNTGIAGKANQQLAEAWNAITDLHARRSAFYHEAAKAGYKTAAERDALLNNPANARKLTEVTRRANKNMVDFGSMTPLEKNTIRRVIYYYPWLSRATIWSLRMLVEHPGKSFTLAQLAQIGAENAHTKIGKMPAWAERLGLFPVGDAHDGKIPVLNPSSINTPSTAAQVGGALVGTVRAAIGFPQGAAGLGDVVTPSIGALSGVAGASGSGATGGSTGLRSIVESHPYYGLGKRAGLWGKPSKTYPDTGVGPALGPFTVGGMYPRSISQSALADQARKAQRAAMSPVQRAAADGKELAQSLHDQAAQHWPEILHNGQIPPEWKEAVRLRTMRRTATAKLGKAPAATASPAEKLAYQQKAYLSDVKLLVTLGKLKPEDGAAAAKFAKVATEDRLRVQRLRLGHGLFRGLVLAHANRTLKFRSQAAAAKAVSP